MLTKRSFITLAVAPSSEALVRHDVAPMAGRVADRGEGSAKFTALRLRQGWRPRATVDRVVLVLQEGGSSPGRSRSSEPCWTLTSAFDHLALCHATRITRRSSGNSRSQPACAPSSEARRGGMAGRRRRAGATPMFEICYRWLCFRNSGRWDDADPARLCSSAMSAKIRPPPWRSSAKRSVATSAAGSHHRACTQAGIRRRDRRRDRNCQRAADLFERCNRRIIRREVTVAGEPQADHSFRIENVRPKRGLQVRLADLHWIDAFVARPGAVDGSCARVG